MDRVRALRDRLEAEVRSITPAAQVIAAGAERLPNTASIALSGVSAETLVIAFDLAGVAVSAGAACSSGKVGASRHDQRWAYERSIWQALSEALQRAGMAVNRVLTPREVASCR